MGNISAYIAVLTACSILCPLVIEGLKKLLKDKQYDVNILAAVTTAVFSLLLCIGYLIIFSVAVSSSDIVYTIAVVFFSVIGSLCGYDKVFKAIFEAIKKDDTTTEVE